MEFLYIVRGNYSGKQEAQTEKKKNWCVCVCVLLLLLLLLFSEIVRNILSIEHNAL